MLVKSPPKKKFINSINYFRGIAIIFIVLGHCYDLSQWDRTSDLAKIFYCSTLNGSVYFVFISGFLFHHIFYHRFEYKKFMIKKIKYVLTPYLCLSIIPIIFTIFLKNGGEFLPDSLRSHPLLAVFWYLITGRISYAYWYIPMAMIIFAVSPAIIWLLESKYLFKVTLSLLALSVIIHRPINNINTLHSFVYFLPVYLLGIYSSINKDKIYQYFKNKRLIALFIVILIAVVQVLVFQEYGNFHKEFWSWSLPDINLLQKIILCWLFMSILDDYEDSEIKILNKTAQTSFAIYFIHPFLINFLFKLVTDFKINYSGNLFILLITTTIIILGSIAIAYIVKNIFKKDSRYLIGW